MGEVALFLYKHMKPLTFTSLATDRRPTTFFLLRKDDIVAVESRPTSAILFLSNGNQVEVQETSDKILSMLHAATALEHN